MIEIFFDGAVWPMNPGGTGSIGVIIRINGEVVHTISKIIGKGALMTNNVAEYQSLIASLKYLQGHGLVNEPIEAYGDSALVCYQMQGKWRIKKGIYRESALQCRELKKNFKDFTITWISRDKNVEADELSKLCQFSNRGK